jgi:hypothetical protein
MSVTKIFEEGGYRFIPAVFQYSAGVTALAGYRIVRVRFSKLLTLSEGFRQIEAWLNNAKRPVTALCACELRSPAPFSETGFREFNEHYVGTLEKWRIMREAINPIARSNVCPVADAPHEPSFYSFSYTETSEAVHNSFVIAGGGEAPEGRANYRDHIVRLGDVGPDGLKEKVHYVLGEMERRMNSLGFTWADTSAVQAYCAHDIGRLFASDIAPRASKHAGLTWQYARPPIVDLEYEMDCRNVPVELII